MKLKFNKTDTEISGIADSISSTIGVLDVAEKKAAALAERLAENPDAEPVEPKPIEPEPEFWAEVTGTKDGFNVQICGEHTPARVQYSLYGDYSHLVSIPLREFGTDQATFYFSNEEVARTKAKSLLREYKKSFDRCKIKFKVTLDDE